MARNQEPIEVSNDQPIQITLGDLKNLLSANGGGASDGALATALQAMAENSKRMAEAILESRKPYEDPIQKENQKKMREQTRESYRRRRENEKFSQSLCPHTQGSNEHSDRSNGESSFAQLMLGTGLVIGVCTNCQRVIHSLDPESAKLFSNKGGNKRAYAGQRIVNNPLQAQLATLDPSEAAKVMRGQLETLT